ncbi:ABC transporter permease [Actinopolymorpha alba]|uniref:ABC transporter permease n=1 Tax=Actinopolymorpha alba TaxID=533267 RepID=UPI0003708F63|nr:ABC transporter permease subunit [Actinopolymorpha alba]
MDTIQRTTTADVGGPAQALTNKLSMRQRFWRTLRKNYLLYLILLPGLLHLVIFKWAPLGGLVIAFQNFSPFQGVFGSQWVGFEQFTKFLHDPAIPHLLANTLLLAFFTLLFSFPAPIIFALFLNEVRNRYVRKSVQTFSFLPYFVSSAVVVSILYTLVSPQGGLVNEALGFFGIKPIFFMAEPGWFRPLYVLINVWQTFGYGTIIYIAAMTTIDPALYEAAEIDGAGRWKKMWNITLPSISNMMIVMFILNIGQILSVDLDKVLLMYGPSVYETADVIQTYVYRQAFAPHGFPNYSYGAAVGLIQAVLALVMVVGANRAAKKFSDSRLF